MYIIDDEKELRRRMLRVLPTATAYVTVQNWDSHGEPLYFVYANKGPDDEIYDDPISKRIYDKLLPWNGINIVDMSDKLDRKAKIANLLND